MKPSGYTLITGGAGFIGSNLAHRLMEKEQPVLIFDSLARPGAETNLRWLREQHAKLMKVQIADIRNRDAIAEALSHATAVYHFAAQVAVTTSMINPTEDFEVNAQGTLNLLEAMRTQEKQIPLLFTSTNKVYGDLDDILMRDNGTRYEPVDEHTRRHGINESRTLAFHSPYGCSKGAADQYILDYAHTYALPATLFRMSCIYGPRQFGTEDQGWVAHFLIRSLRRQPITLYGDGKQVRDILFVDDLVNALQLAHSHIEQTAGQAYNIGGGPSNTTSLLELLDFIEEIQGVPVSYSLDDWRRGDQRYYVSDTRKFEQTTGWSTQVSMAKGLARLYAWLQTMHSQSTSKKAATQAKPVTRQPFESNPLLPRQGGIHHG